MDRTAGSADPNGRLLVQLSRLRERPEVVSWRLAPGGGTHEILAMTGGVGKVEIHDPSKASVSRPFFPIFWLDSLMNQRQKAAAALAAVEVAREALPVDWRSDRKGFTAPWFKGHYDNSILALPVELVRGIFRGVRLSRGFDRRSGSDSPEARILYAWETALGVAAGEGEMPDNWISPFQDSQTAMAVSGRMTDQQFGWAWLDRFEFLLRGHKADPTVGRMRPREEDPELKPLVAPARALHRELAQSMGEAAVISVSATRAGDDGHPVIAVVWRDGKLAQDGQDNLAEWRGWPVVHIGGQGRVPSLASLVTGGLTPAQENALIERNLAKPVGKRFVREMQDLLGKTEAEALRALVNVKAWIPLLDTARKGAHHKRRAAQVAASLSGGVWRHWDRVPVDPAATDREQAVRVAVGRAIRDARAWKRTPPIQVVGRNEAVEDTRSMTELLLRVGSDTWRVRFPTYPSIVGGTSEMASVEYLEQPGTQ